MRYNIDDRLSRLKTRRTDASNTAMMGMGFRESFENRTANKSTKYALGSMQEVDARSTEISKEEAIKVENALTTRLKDYGLSPVFRLQGSVPMNTHIRGVSDVDLLEIHERYFTFSSIGPKANTYTLVTDGTTAAQDVLKMRSYSEIELAKHFHGSNVDTSNAKSIQLSEGGFRRKVDVVPSHWYNSNEYQTYGFELFRGVNVIDKYTGLATTNYPFRFADAIKTKAASTNDGALMAIRLLKNIKSDGDEDIGLSSYDIAGLIYHCPDVHLQRLAARDLMILSGTQEWLQILLSDKDKTLSLFTPDFTRKIVDTNEKWTGLQRLSKNLTDLAREVDNEITGPYYFGERPLNEIQKHLNESQIPLVPQY